MRQGWLIASAVAIAVGAGALWADESGDMKGMDMEGKAGKTVTLTGEVLDMDCYMNEGAHGKDHQACAVMCLNNGAPVGLLTADGKAYFLTANEGKGKMKFYDSVRGWGGERVKVTGVLQKRAGANSLRVDSAEKL